MNIRDQTGLPGLGELGQDRCCMCGLAIPELLTDAHLHGDARTIRLCWTCHRAYDIDILTTKEVLAAQMETRVGSREVDATALHREWARDLLTGKRRINKQRQHHRTPEQSSANARKAWQTMRAAATRADDDTSLQPKLGPKSEELPIFGRR